MPLGRQREVAFVRLVLFGSLACSIVLGGVAVYKRALPVEVLAALLVVTASAWFLLAFLWDRGRPVAWLISLGVLNLMLLVPELTLRIAGFRHESGIELDLTEEEAFQKLVRDPELFWTLDPSRPEINSWGFPGPEVEVPKPDGVFRVLVLGDSCAQWGRPHPYPEIVARLLNEARPGAAGRRVEVVSLSSAGYTSHQGLVVARKYGARVAPDVVVVHYGWNDHWLAYGSPDAEVEKPTDLGEFLDRCYESSRLVQYAHFATNKLRAALSPPVEKLPPDLRQVLGLELRDVPRVSRERFRQNLSRIAELFEESGAPLVFITAPSAHRTLGTPPHFVEYHYATDPGSVIDWHTRYAEIVRDVGNETGQRVLDLESEMGTLGGDQLRELFLFDGIHFTEPGCEFVGRRLADYLAREFDL